jgi:hypothetical protein
MLTQRSARAGPALRRDALAGWFARPANVALAAAAAAWAVGLAMVLWHRLFVTNDSLNNYAHVWYISDQLWQAHRLPLHMPMLGHGDAFAFPYAFVPWTTAAVLRPLFGDWTVTLWLVLGFVGVVAAMWWAFPELREGWWPALLLLNPMLVETVILGQLPFLWAAAFLFAAIGAWRRVRRLFAAVLRGVAQATLAAEILPSAGVLVLMRIGWERDRIAMLAWYALSLVIAAPAVLLVLLSPAVGDSTRVELAGNFFGTVTLRALVIGGPFIALALRRSPLARVPAVLFAVLVALNIGLTPVRHNGYAWGALTRTPDTSLEGYIGSPAFERGATYRLLRVGDGKVGMYRVIRAGGRLDAEFFPESIGRRSFSDTSAYADFLRKREVDVVIVYRAYDERYGTNEHELLDRMAVDPTSAARNGGLCVQRQEHTADYDVYAISGCASVRAH